MMMDINGKELTGLIAAALAEDGSENDVTCEFLGIADADVDAAIIARTRGIVAGLDVARRVFEEADPAIGFAARVGEGDHVDDGDVVVRLHGPARGILVAERVALNFLQRLSGVATLTSTFVEAVRGTGVRILDTRKTTPLLRRMEKYAVTVGGGENHRYILSDMVLVKENHFRAIGGGRAFIDILKTKKPPVAVEVEVDSLSFLRELLGSPVDRIMLDNFSPDEVAAAVRIIADHRLDHPGFRPEIEVSGGVNLENIRDFALAGVNFISIGALTHSARALDMSLEVGRDGS
ncbi:MAG: carboxylating nicotinate-nucleotide diphosphorylase [bacterium]